MIVFDLPFSEGVLQYDVSKFELQRDNPMAFIETACTPLLICGNEIRSIIISNTPVMHFLSKAWFTSK
jgi:hypothetical protein